jgi:putative membrane protein
MTMKTQLALATALAITCTAHVGAKDTPMDQDFVTQASQGGAAEVELGKVAASQGSSDDVKAFGQRMADDHTKAGAQLTTAASSGGFTVATSPSAQQKADAAKLKSLQGAAFDKAYAAAMVKDHKETVALFEKEAKSGSDANLKAFAAETLPTLKEHTKMAEQLKASGK